MFTGEFFPVGRRLDPWRELERFQDEFINRVFGAYGEAAPTETPQVNVWTGPEGAVVTAQVPGAKQESLDISVLGETLTLRGELDEEKLEEGWSLHRRERPTGGFSRTVTLPFRIEADRVRASYKDGVLDIFLPRRAEDKPRRINIKAE